MDTVQVRATRDQIEELKNSILWADIVAELESWKHGFQIEQDGIVDDAANSNPSTASVLLHLGDLNGRRKAVDYLISLPDVFLSIIESREHKQEETTDEN